MSQQQSPSPTPPRCILIAGCGFLGKELARASRDAGWTVYGLTHTASSAAEVASELGFTALTADLADRATLERMKNDLPELSAVVHCASTKGGDAENYRRVYADGCRNLAEVFAPAKVVFVSSTSVYGQVDGETVDETSPTEPTRETGKVLLEAEAHALRSGGSVTRLAGIYGPGRSFLLKRFLEGSATIDEGVERSINQIHRDDAAAAILYLIENQIGGVFNVADDVALTQREIFTNLAERFERSLPPLAPRDTGKKRGWTNKVVANTKLRASGWSPQFPSFLAAVENDPRLIQSIQSQLFED